MKKFAILIIILYLPMVGCELIFGPDEKFDPIVLIVFPDKDTIPYGEKAYLKIVMENVKSFTVNDKEYEGKDVAIVPTQNLFTTETFIIKAIGFDGKSSKTAEATVVVSDPTAPIVTINPIEPISYKTKAVFSWTVSGWCDTVKVNNVIVTNNTFTTQILEKDTEFSVSAYGPGGVGSSKITIKVLAPTKTDILCDRDWTTKYIGWIFSLNDTLSMKESGQIIKFNPDSNNWKWVGDDNLWIDFQWTSSNGVSGNGLTYKYKMSDTRLELIDDGNTFALNGVKLYSYRLYVRNPK